MMNTVTATTIVCVVTSICSLVADITQADPVGWGYTAALAWLVWLLVVFHAIANNTNKANGRGDGSDCQ